MSEKKCKYCGTDDIIIDSKGRKYSYCKKCKNKRHSEKLRGRKYSDERRQNISNALKGKKKSEEHKANIKKAMPESMKKRKKTNIKKYGVDNLFKDNDYIKKKFKEKYGVDNAMKINEIILKNKQSAQETWNNKTEEEMQHFSEKIKKGKLNMPTEKKEQMCKKLSNSNKIRLKNRTKEQINAFIQKRHKTMKKNKTYGKSKIENKFYEYLIKYIDANTDRQVECQGFLIDFYLPGYDMYVQFDGDYWHGYLHTEEELMKSKQGKIILKTMERDEKQNELIPNLVRIREGEFKNSIEYKLIKYKPS